jgi:NAD(P)-dependent dehydrogenase (short-subunit alcohol dehydrogenase family)
MNLFDLSGRVGLVTGSSRGIGFALAKGLLQAGARQDHQYRLGAEPAGPARHRAIQRHQRRHRHVASPASDFVNGQVLFVDGGMTAVV